MKRVWIKALDYVIKTRTGRHGATRDVAPMCIGRLAECDLNCPKVMASHAMTAGTLGSALALADAINPTRTMVTNPERATTVSERRDLHAMRAVLGPSFPSIDGPNHVVWPRLCEAMADWRSTHECCRLELLDVARSPWTAHHGLYREDLLGVVLSMRWSRKRWVRSWFNRLCRQYCCDTAVELTDCLRTVMDREDSIVYVGFSFTSSRPYSGAVEARHLSYDGMSTGLPFCRVAGVR